MHTNTHTSENMQVISYFICKGSLEEKSNTIYKCIKNSQASENLWIKDGRMQNNFLPKTEPQSKRKTWSLRQCPVWVQIHMKQLKRVHWKDKVYSLEAWTNVQDNGKDQRVPLKKKNNGRIPYFHIYSIQALSLLVMTTHI